MGKKKTELTYAQICEFLQTLLVKRIENVQQLVEGEESQAFVYKYAEKEYVLRINHKDAGFWKDKYAAEHFNCEQLPIPQVIQIGCVDEYHAFCITEKLPGFTLQDADVPTLKRLLEPNMHIWLALQGCDLCDTTGFGDFDAYGQGAYATWQKFLLSLLDASTHKWEPVIQFMGHASYESFVAKFISLIQYCPEERYLVHGDFGANNVLTDGQVITAVLDWENAKYGDALFDVAIAHFWSPWLDCMAIQAEYYDTLLSTLPGYHQRLLCYQLRIGLEEIYDQVLHQNWDEARWAVDRCTDITYAL